MWGHAMRVVLSLLLVARVAVAAPPAPPTFVEPPIVSRYDGSIIKNQTRVAFDRTVLTTGFGKDGKLSEQSYEGQRIWTALQGPKGRSSFEVFASYRDAIAQAGFDTVFTCSREQCPNKLFTNGLGGDVFSPLHQALVQYGDGSTADRYYLLAKRATAAGDEYIRLVVTNPKLPVTLLDVLQPATREQKVTVLSQEAIARDIERSGKAVLYAIFFDFDRAEIKPESAAQLIQLAGFLTANPRVNVYIVGHTDAKGTLDYNADLSRRRAAAIATALTQIHAIAPARVSAQSVGELAPVATNETEAGRALNRRVEIVKRLD
jgi:OmpA-OmpF porin, OOP family